jgi:dynactin complex subunit
MTCRNTILKERLVIKEAQLAKLYIQLDQAIDNIDIESYSLDTGNGKQATKRRRPAEIQELIDILEREIDALRRKLRGTGIVSLNTSRYC